MPRDSSPGAPSDREDPFDRSSRAERGLPVRVRLVTPGLMLLLLAAGLTLFPLMAAMIRDQEAPARNAPRGRPSSVSSLAFSPSGDLLASSSKDGTVRLWSALSAQVQGIFYGHEQAVRGVAFSPDGRT